MAISTKDVKSGSGLPKLIEPGVQELKINAVKLQRFPFMEADQGYYFMLEVESRPIDNFEGFFIDSTDESKGKYLGQIGSVKTSQFYYKDGVTKSGTEVSRDMEILRQIRSICTACNCLDWFEKADGQYDTIEDFVAAFDSKKPFKDVFLRFCIAGKEYDKKNNFIGYDLYLPKYVKGKVTFESLAVKISKIIPFDPATHIVPKTENTVNEFGDDTDASSNDDLITNLSDDPFVNSQLGDDKAFEL